MSFPQESRYLLVQNEKTAVIDWMILSGANYDEVNYENRHDLEQMVFHGIEYYMGPATCDVADEITIDKEDSWVSPIKNPHHDFEIAALSIVGSPFSEELLAELVAGLTPMEFEDFQNSEGLPDLCWPLSIEVADDGHNINVWVAKRFRAGDSQSPDFHQAMADFINLAEIVRSTCTS
jgi:hypothetical protein